MKSRTTALTAALVFLMMPAQAAARGGPNGCIPRGGPIEMDLPLLEQDELDFLIEAGEATIPAVVDLLRQDRTSLVGHAMAWLIQEDQTGRSAAAIGLRLRKAKGQARQSLLSTVAYTDGHAAMHEALVRTLVELVDEASDEWQVRNLYQAIARGGAQGRATLKRYSETGPQPVDAALTAHPPESGDIELLLAVLEAQTLDREERIQLLGRVRVVVRESGLPTPHIPTARRIGEAVAAEPDERARWFGVEALALGGKVGRRELARRLLDTDEPERAEQYVAGLRRSFGQAPPEELLDSPRSTHATHDLERWRAWARSHSAAP